MDKSKQQKPNVEEQLTDEEIMRLMNEVRLTEEEILAIMNDPRNYEDEFIHESKKTVSYDWHHFDHMDEQEFEEYLEALSDSEY